MAVAFFGHRVKDCRLPAFDRLSICGVPEFVKIEVHPDSGKWYIGANPYPVRPTKVMAGRRVVPAPPRFIYRGLWGADDETWISYQYATAMAFDSEADAEAFVITNEDRMRTAPFRS